MKDISTGKNTVNIGFEAVVDDRTGGDWGKLDPGTPAQFILREKSTGEQQCVAASQSAYSVAGWCDDEETRPYDCQLRWN